jgi:hypothetical protein
LIEVSAILFWGLVEITVLLLVILIIMLAVAMRRRSQRLAAVRALAAAVKKGMNDRADRMKEILSNRYGYQDDKLKKTTKTIKRREASFYQALLALIKDNDMGRLKDMRMQFENAVDPYRNLDIPKVVAEETKVDQHHPELESLRQKNRELTEELGITMETLGRMLQEYSTMFDPEDRAKAEALVASEPTAATDESPATEDEGAEQAATPEAPSDDDLLNELMGDEAPAVESEAKPQEAAPAAKASPSDDDLLNELMGDEAPAVESEAKPQETAPAAKASPSDDDLLNELMGENASAKAVEVDPDELLQEIAGERRDGLISDVDLNEEK